MVNPDIFQFKSESLKPYPYATTCRIFPAISEHVKNLQHYFFYPVFHSNKTSTVITCILNIVSEACSPKYPGFFKDFDMVFYFPGKCQNRRHYEN